jgi:hypothetical protein
MDCIALRANAASHLQGAGQPGFKWAGIDFSAD